MVSTGGQIMPPVMGAAAFIMAEIVGTPYVNVMKAGLIPALLFFLSILFVVHLQALKSGIEPNRGSDDEAEARFKTVLKGLPFIIPFVSLIGMMIAGYSPVKSSFFAIVILLVLHLVITREFSQALFSKIGRATIAGVRSAVPISIACAAAGIISGTLSVTGLGSKLSIFIISLSLWHSTGRIAAHHGDRDYPGDGACRLLLPILFWQRLWRRRSPIWVCRS